MRDNIRKICYVFYSVLGRYYVLTDQYLIKERPRKALFYFALPMIIGNIFQQTYTMVDSMVVGRYVGEDAMAAIGACYSFTNIFIWVAGGGGIGASVIVSRLFGAGQYQRMKTAIRTALLSFLALSVVLGAVGLLIGSPVMRLLRTPASDSLQDRREFCQCLHYGEGAAVRPGTRAGDGECRAAVHHTAVDGFHRYDGRAVRRELLRRGITGRLFCRHANRKFLYSTLHRFSASRWFGSHPQSAGL